MLRTVVNVTAMPLIKVSSEGHLEELKKIRCVSENFAFILSSFLCLFATQNNPDCYVKKDSETQGKIKSELHYSLKKIYFQISNQKKQPPNL